MNRPLRSRYGGSDAPGSEERACSKLSLAEDMISRYEDIIRRQRRKPCSGNAFSPVAWGKASDEHHSR